MTITIINGLKWSIWDYGFLISRYWLCQTIHPFIMVGQTSTVSIEKDVHIQTDPRKQFHKLEMDIFAMYSERQISFFYKIQYFTKECSNREQHDMYAIKKCKLVVRYGWAIFSWSNKTIDGVISHCLPKVWRIMYKISSQHLCICIKNV